MILLEKISTSFANTWGKTKKKKFGPRPRHWSGPTHVLVQEEGLGDALDGEELDGEVDDGDVGLLVVAGEVLQDGAVVVDEDAGEAELGVVLLEHPLDDGPDPTATHLLPEVMLARDHLQGRKHFKKILIFFFF